MDSITRIKEYIKKNFSNWVKVDYSEFNDQIDFRKDWSELYKINDEEIIPYDGNEEKLGEIVE